MSWACYAIRQKSTGNYLARYMRPELANRFPRIFSRKDFAVKALKHWLEISSGFDRSPRVASDMEIIRLEIHESTPASLPR
jgi:hypothetical protein